MKQNMKNENILKENRDNFPCHESVFDKGGKFVLKVTTILSSFRLKANKANENPHQQYCFFLAEL